MAQLRTSATGYRHIRRRLTRTIVRPPFRDEIGRKGWFQNVSRAQPHAVRHLRLDIAGWPRGPRPLRVAFLSDLHTGSHHKDVERLHSIVSEISGFSPDLALFGGDYVNMQLIGGGRVPPRVIAKVLGRLHAPLGLFATLGNHDYAYDERLIAGAFEDNNITVLADESRRLDFASYSLRIVGIPDARVVRNGAISILANLAAEPAIVLAHDPMWFASLAAGPFLMLAGHTHGGQVRLPGIGVLRNASKAPLRWSYGLIREKGKVLYVTSGIGTSGIPFRLRMPPEYVILDLG